MYVYIHTEITLLLLILLTSKLFINSQHLGSMCLYIYIQHGPNMS